jgi:membrane protein implicated in regulation of membrane protease activity
MELWILWLIIILCLTLLEIATVGLVSIWFIASAIVALILSFFISSFYIQFLVFVALGIILLITTRPILNKFIKPKNSFTNLDRVVGMTGVVTEDIIKNDVGEVKVDGKRWSAISKKEIKKGTNVIIKAIDGVKLIVEKEGD